MLGFVSKEARRITKLRLDQHPSEVRISLARWPVALWHLPFGYLVRLIDCFLLEGPKVFFRAGLLLWRFAARLEKSAGQTANDSFDLISAARNLNISSSAFIRKLFAIRNLGRESVKRSLEMARQSESSKTGDQSGLEDALIHPCKRAGYTTYASYLVGDDHSSPCTAGGSQAQFQHPSDCVTVSELATLITSIKDNKWSQLSKPVLLFSTNRDGTSLRTMYARAADALDPASLLLVRTRSGRSVIGAFCTDRWQARSQFPLLRFRSVVFVSCETWPACHLSMDWTGEGWRETLRSDRPVPILHRASTSCRWWSWNWLARFVTG
ncbi:hypothetical protein FGIG_10035 [Fasciola gigantica]|uniref:TLDc domain-containing protein n=1 Tax=Fasciola gigantica TaxID=46835 RepID=A0A504YXA1_FASGI|nr:hypothetical protein FGIG_10035 [Fasciola gigantica]